MKGNVPRVVRYGASLLGLVTLGWVLAGQTSKPVFEGLPTDWSHHHLIFSHPATATQAELLARDLRYRQQWYRTNALHGLPVSFPFSSRPNSTMHGDWAMDLGSGGSMGAGDFPAKYSFSVSSASCANDFVVFSTGLVGGLLQASVVAYNNLYTGCGSSVPSYYWAYNTGGQIKTSPVFSLDGSQIAFVQTNAGAASLVLLKWVANSSESVTSPDVPTIVAAGLYSACVAPCMTTFPLLDGSNVATDDTTSSVFYNYGGDIAWVGDSRSWLHQFTPVFNGTALNPPAEVRTAPWPVHLTSGSLVAASSPVFDFKSGNVFVGDYGGFFYRVSASTGAVTKSGQVDFGTNGLIAGPVVDSSAGEIYVFSKNDNTGNAAVYQFGVAFAPGATGGGQALVGASSPTNPLYEGAFDNQYLTSSAPRTGNLYVCGNPGGIPTHYQIPIAADVMGAVVTGPTLASAATVCSPVSDIANPNAIAGGTEWIFASAQASGSGNSCSSGGCVMNFVDKSWMPRTNYAVGEEVLDSHFQIQVVRVGGMSKAGAHPTWSVAVDGSTNDGTVRWTNQGPLVAAYATWTPSHAYALDEEIVDSNGNIEAVTSAGNSKAGSHPTWNTAINGLTNEGAGLVRWHNVGAIATASLAAAGGSSGMIMDNVATSPAGTSQVYFSTLSNQTCTTSGGTGGCAVQASQSALQ